MAEASRTALRGVIKRARTFQEMAPSQGEDGFVQSEDDEAEDRDDAKKAEESAEEDREEV